MKRQAGVRVRVEEDGCTEPPTAPGNMILHQLTGGTLKRFSSVEQKGQQKKGRRMLSFRLAYIFSYNLFQFCGHTWILSNTIARFLTFGQDAVADTFYSVGFVMSLCQLFSILELFHIADGIEKAKLLPRFIQTVRVIFFQVLEKNVLLIMVIILEEIRSNPAVCVQFFLWNILDLLRYPHELLCVLDRPSTAMLWTRYTLRIPLYILSVASEGEASHCEYIVCHHLPGADVRSAHSFSQFNHVSTPPPALRTSALPASSRSRRRYHRVAAAKGAAAAPGEVEQEDEEEMTCFVEQCFRTVEIQFYFL
ncbi:very-long-chain (3R)-3-hydroxyacyl-CoA dehydratase 4 isoform X1 [Brachyistius frenatus]|uniref:very-long-chain (3R)-3-hydroxyacyl-CoA dehydratase 4 isoform X1 n=1 Tax=Brachyistius frenatus TaxID=100188 RepID=UPI0037E9841B